MYYINAAIFKSHGLMGISSLPYKTVASTSCLSFKAGGPCCWNKSPHTERLEDYLTVQEVRTGFLTQSEMGFIWLQVRSQQDDTPSGSSRGESGSLPFPCLFRTHVHSLAPFLHHFNLLFPQSHLFISVGRSSSASLLETLVIIFRAHLHTSRRISPSQGFLLHLQSLCHIK